MLMFVILGWHREIIYDLSKAHVSFHERWILTLSYKNQLQKLVRTAMKQYR